MADSSGGGGGLSRIILVIIVLILLAALGWIGVYLLGAVNIVAPPDAAVFAPGQSVQFRGRFTFGQVVYSGGYSDRIEWRSSLNGYLGTGREVTVPVVPGCPPFLNQGAHVIRAEVEGPMYWMPKFRDTISIAVVPNPKLAAPWARQFGGQSFDSGRSIAVDGQGNVLVTGIMTRTVDFGGGPLASAGLRDVFVAKFAPNGNHLWSRSFGAAEQDEGHAISVDPQGNVLLTGSFEGVVNFGGGALTSAGEEDVFVVKLNGSDGTHLWSKSFGGTGQDKSRGIAVDRSGDAVVTGRFWHTVNFGGQARSSAGGPDIFMVKLAGSNGGMLWAKSFGDILNDEGVAVATDPQGDVLATGYFQHFNDGVDFGGGPLPEFDNFDVFVVKLAGGDGAHLWSKSLGGAGFEEAWAIASDCGGNAVVTGYFTDTADFGGGALTSVGSTDIFVVKLSGANGAHAWSRRFGNSDSDLGQGVAVDSAGGVAVTGVVRVSGSGQAWMARLAGNNGATQSSRQFGGAAGGAAGWGISLDFADNVVLTGGFGGTLDFGEGPFTVLGSSDVFVVKTGP